MALALVAYSDESDVEEDQSEQENRDIKCISDSMVQNISTVSDRLQNRDNISVVTNENNKSSIDDIVDEDEDFLTYNEKTLSSNGSVDSKNKELGDLLSSIPSRQVQTNQVVTSELDQVNDVPTIHTWKTTQDILKSKVEGNDSAGLRDKSNNEKVDLSKKKKKLQFIIPSLSEFSDDEEPEEPKKKVPRPASDGCGLFSLLPPPISVKQFNRPLIPHTLTKKKTNNVPVKPKPISKCVSSNSLSHDISMDSDEEDLSEDNEHQDFFSLSEKDNLPPVSVIPTTLNTHRPNPKAQVNNIAEVCVSTQITSTQPMAQNVIAHDNKLVTESVDKIEFSPVHQVESSNKEIDAAALARLVGRRNKHEVIDFVDFNADDVLLNREEWVNKALTEEKPTYGFSNKKEGMPTKQQKRKHQITSLAREAKERELELKNEWANNRMTKKDTQSKYGF